MKNKKTEAKNRKRQRGLRPATLLGGIVKLLKRYRDNRNAQETRKWDKQKDLDEITDAWLKEKCGAQIEACAGRFWFTLRDGKVIQVDVDRYWQPKWYAA